MALRPRHLARYRHIVEVFTRHGFGAIVAQLELDRRLDLRRRLLRREPELESRTSAAEHVRLALQELGATFVKLGQILSTRPDLLPPDVISELSLLQDSVPPAPWEGIQERIEAELGGPMDQFFLAFDPTPIAAASLGQVYAALLPDGKDVVVKILRPGICRTVEIDLEILRDLAYLAQDRLPLSDSYDLVELADEFAHALRAELDYRREGRNADKFRNNFVGEDRLYVPKVYWEHTTRRVMAQERIVGIKINNLAALQAEGCNQDRLAEICAQLVVKEVMEDGYFHADPHPGNLLVLPGEVIGLIDFGTVGHLAGSDRSDLIRLYIMLVQMDVIGMVDQLARMGIAGPRTNQRALQKDLRRLLLKYHGLPLKDIAVGEILTEIEPVIYTHHLYIPSDYWLLIKTLAMMEGVGKMLSPDFDIFAFSEPYVKQFLLKMWLPSEWGPSFARGAAGWADLMSSIPRRSMRLMDQMEQGDLEFQMRTPDLQKSTRQMHYMTNRLVLSILLAALITALAQLIPILDLTWPWSLLTWTIVSSFGVASILAIWLIIWILRSRHRS